MNNKCDDFIQYSGISSDINTKIEYFTQSNTSSTFSISNNKKNINQITKVHVLTDIIQSSIIVTPRGKSLEGQVLTGYKMLIDFDLNIKMEYISNDESNSVQYVTKKIPYSTNVSIVEDYDDSMSVYPSIKIEDIYCKLLSNKKIYINISLVSIVDIF